MNVLHYGLILSQPYDITRGLREIGIPADYAMWDDFGEGWLIKGCDINLKMGSIRGALGSIERQAKFGKFLLEVIEKYDVIHFHSFPTLWYANQLLSTYKDTSVLKSFRKKLFLSVWGCDVRNWRHDILYPWSPCNRCEIYRKTYCGLTRKKIIDAASKYCSATFSSGDLILEYPDFHWSNAAVDTVDITPDVTHHIPKKYLIERESDEFIIYHSFGHSEKRPDVKGSGYIRTTIEKLKREGYNVKYIFIDGVPTRDMKYIQCQADIVIDQLCAGWYGVTAVEAMSLGKPVLTYLRDDIISICPNENIPIVNTNPKTLEQTLIELIGDPGKLKELGKSGREYAVKYHDRKAVAKEFVKYYEE